MTDLQPQELTKAEELLGLCRKLDEETAEQLEEIAVSFEMTNNRDTAAELNHLAAWKSAQAEAIGVPTPGGLLDWYVIDPGDPDALHYLMRPWHLLGIVMDNERRMRDVLAAVVTSATTAELRQAAERMVARQDENLGYLEARRAVLPEPEPGWDDDEDEPFFDQ